MLISPEKHVVLRLTTTPKVVRLVGFQVYAMAVPSKSMATLPFLIYRRASISRESHLSGSLLLPVVSLQIAAWGLHYDTARELADSVRTALDGHTGTLAGCTIEDMRLVNETDDYLDPTVAGAQLPPAYEVRQLYHIRWQDAVG
jgi:hypothetical protein